MKITVLHSKDALDPPVDPLLDQLDAALAAGGHTSRRLAVDDTVQPLIDELTKEEPDLVFNLAESFRGKSALESNVAALLNLTDLRYTGSSPAGLILAGDKTLTKKVLAFHGILSAKFATMYRGQSDWVGDIKFPLLVKPPQEDASLGITQKSIVNDVKELLDVISSTQQEYQSAVLVEEFIDGREFYVGVIGTARWKRFDHRLDFRSFRRVCRRSPAGRRSGATTATKRERSSRGRSRYSRPTCRRSWRKRFSRSPLIRFRRCGCGTTRASISGSPRVKRST